MNFKTRLLQSSQWFGLVLGSAVLIALPLFFVFSPIGHSAVGGWLPQGKPSTEPSNEPQAITRVIPAISFEEAQQQMPFRIPLPTWLPEGVTLRGAHVDPPKWVNVFFARTDPQPGVATGGMGIQIIQGERDGTIHFDGSRSEDVTVNGHPAVLEWVEGSDTGAVEWATDGFHYRAGTSGLGMNREELIRFAESIQ